jgi:hypothetical protein
VVEFTKEKTDVKACSGESKPISPISSPVVGPDTRMPLLEGIQERVKGDGFRFRSGDDLQMRKR